MADKYELGMQRLRDILGKEADVQGFSEISEDFAKYVVECAYGDFYAHRGITDQTRELAAVASLIGQGNTGFPLRAHLIGMLNAGWSRAEIIEILMFLIVYVGFPRIVDAMHTAQAVFLQQTQ